MITELKKMNLSIFSEENLEISIKVINIVNEILYKNPYLIEGFWHRFKESIPDNYNVTIDDEKSFEIIFLVCSSKKNLYSLFLENKRKKETILLKELRV